MKTEGDPEKKGFVEMRSGPLLGLNDADGEERFNPKEFVSPGSTNEDALMRSGMSAEETAMVRLISAQYLAHVCGIVLPLWDLRMHMLGSAARDGRATTHMRDVAIAAMGMAADQDRREKSGREGGGGFLARLLGRH